MSKKMIKNMFQIKIINFVIKKLYNQLKEIIKSVNNKEIMSQSLHEHDSNCDETVNNSVTRYASKSSI